MTDPNQTAEAWDGIPLNPDRSGWHWLRRGRNLAPWHWTDEHGAPGEFIWSTDNDSDPADMARQFHYVAPCLAPRAEARSSLNIIVKRDMPSDELWVHPAMFEAIREMLSEAEMMRPFRGNLMTPRAEK